MRDADVARYLGKSPTVLKVEKKSLRLLKHLQRFEFVPCPQVRHTEVVNGLGFSGAVSRRPQQGQRLRIVFDCSFLVAEIVMDLADAVEHPAE